MGESISMIKPENLVAANVTIREFKKLELMRESVSRCNFTVYAGLSLEDEDQKELLSGEAKTKIAAIIDVDLHKHQRSSRKTEGDARRYERVQGPAAIRAFWRPRARPLATAVMATH